MALLPALPGDAVAGIGGGLVAAIVGLWRLSRGDCEKQIDALKERVTQLEARVTELTERLIAEARTSRTGD